MKNQSSKMADEAVVLNASANMDEDDADECGSIEALMPSDEENEDEDNPAEELPAELQAVVVPKADPAREPTPGPSHFILTPSALRKLLQKTEGGKIILQKAQQGELSEKNQLRLAGIIAKHHLSLQIRATSEQLEHYCLAITTLFQAEKKENYYIPRGGARKNVGGKIINKIGNLKQKNRRIQRTEEEHSKKIKATSANPQPSEPSSEPNEATVWLVLNQNPWSTVLDKWAASYPDRSQYLGKLKSTPQLLKEFPHYLQEYGYQLIDKDFTCCFPNLSKGMDSLKAIGAELEPYFRLKAIDPTAETLLQHLQSENDDTRVCTTLLLLNTVLPPISAGARYKPTIIVAQEDTILFAETAEDVASKVANVMARYRERKLPSAPKLVFQGSGIEDLGGQFWVVYENLLYKLPSAARAVDVLIKTTAVFNLPYAKESRLVWHFLSDVVYGIASAENYSSINKVRSVLDAVRGRITEP